MYSQIKKKCLYSIKLGIIFHKIMKNLLRLFIIHFILYAHSNLAQNVIETIIQQGHPASVNHVAISPDRQLLATAGKDKTIALMVLKSEAVDPGSGETLTGFEFRIVYYPCLFHATDVLLFN